MAITFTGLGQQMPYNPDANGDDFVGVDDVLGVLGVYDTALMQPDLQCDYEGTDFEQMIIGLIEGTLILDSVYVEYLLFDTATYFTPGCPDEVVEPIVLERSYMLTQPNNGIYNNGLFVAKVMGQNVLGFWRQMELAYNGMDNTFELAICDSEIDNLMPSLGQCSWWHSNNSSGLQLPFPENWTIDEDGIQVSWEDQPDIWTTNAEHFRIIPFWHEAE
jgi:hypothetical protein